MNLASTSHKPNRIHVCMGDVMLCKQERQLCENTAAANELTLGVICPLFIACHGIHGE